MRSAAAPAVRERDIVIPERPQLTALAARPREISPTVRMPDVAVRTAALPSVPDPAPAPVAVAPAVPAASATANPTPTAAAVQHAQPAPQPAQSQANPAPPQRSSNASAAASSAPSQLPAARSRPTAAAVGMWPPMPTTGANPTAIDKATPQVQTVSATACSMPMAASTSPPEPAMPGRARATVAPGSETDTWTRDQIAQGGTWLKRPPYGYTPTSLDKYWIPNQTLLQEWVRRGLKKIEIPIRERPPRSAAWCRCCNSAAAAA